MVQQLFSTPTSLGICSRCLNHEINSWVNEKWQELDEEVKKQIHEELKSIKLKPGKCIVCSNSLVSDNTPENILKILDISNISSEVRKEFKRFFCVSSL